MRSLSRKFLYLAAGMAPAVALVMMRKTFFALAVPVLLVLSGCSGADSNESAQSDDELATAINLKDYAMASGVVAVGADARSLFEDIQANGGKDGENGSLFAGMTGEELDLADANDRKAAWGISCSPKEADSLVHLEACSLNAIVKTSGQKKQGETGYVISITGKLAEAIASSLPQTSPEGLVGSTTTGSGKISCKTIRGPTGSVCTVPIIGGMETMDGAVKTTGSDKVTAAQVRKFVKAFF